MMVSFMKETKLKFTYMLGHGMDEYPEDLQLSVEFNGDANFSQVLTAFRMFLYGVEYSDHLIEGLGYEYTSKDFE